ncbi:MAG: hypothetical protein ACT7A5_04345 [Ferrovibrionaceae bacterium]
MLVGRIIIGAVLLVGLGLSGCTAPPRPTGQAGGEPARPVPAAKGSRTDLRKASLARMPAAIPAPVQRAGKDDIPRLATADDKRPAKPTIRF